MYWVLISVFVYLCWVHIAIKRRWDITHQRLVRSIDMVLGVACLSMYLRAAPIPVALWSLTAPAFMVVVLLVLRWITGYQTKGEWFKSLCYTASIGLIFLWVLAS